MQLEKKHEEMILVKNMKMRRVAVYVMIGHGTVVPVLIITLLIDIHTKNYTLCRLSII